MPRKPGEHVLANGPLTKWEIADITGIPIDLVETYLWDHEAMGIVEQTEGGWRLTRNRVRLVIKAWD
ncbi:hypothetical protein [Natrarchaeobaculum sulfurireducens]|uniref:Uncharacterized protein n=1 Tax=Natrarchaeobaculum sulfurireducens TaxID=2044521 RepID=A0A346PPN4_9EURY|nr:hypothetical protein [Natrarchaeobaculum sulfurireducens]AXR81479.1 hypothetical protein AArcMg_1466 [Natrarchaeobaculum sulfurireducens]